MCPVCLVCFFSIICIKPGCVFYRYTACFFDEKKANYCKIQVSSLRRFAFATLRWPHCVRPPTPLRQPGSATRLITVLAPSTPSPFRCSDYMTTPIIYCYIFRPPGKWFWTILHATSSLPARWTPLVERKPDSKESGIVGPSGIPDSCRVSSFPPLHFLKSAVL